MQKGATLHLHFGRERNFWHLSTGKLIPAEVAKMVLKDVRVVGSGDGLIAGADQTDCIDRLKTASRVSAKLVK